MNIRFVKSTLLKWIFLPVIICVRLIVIPVEELILYISNVGVVGFHFIHQELDLQTNTIVDRKVRMNN